MDPIHVVDGTLPFSKKVRNPWALRLVAFSTSVSYLGKSPSVCSDMSIGCLYLSVYIPYPIQNEKFTPSCEAPGSAPQTVFIFNLALVHIFYRCSSNFTLHLLSVFFFFRILLLQTNVVYCQSCLSCITVYFNVLGQEPGYLDASEDHRSMYKQLLIMEYI